jgi:hypothetical protein
MTETIIEAVGTEGGCLCGAVRYRVTAPAVSTSNCHCTMCQKAAGAPFVSWMTFPIECFVITKGKIKIFKSSMNAERGFCDTCGSALTFADTDDPGLIDITTATADDPTAWPPTHHIWTSTRIPWLHAKEDLPSYESRAPKD